MSNEEGCPLTFSECVAKRVRAARKARGWSVKALAARCQQAGYPELTAGALYVLEGPRPRSVTVDEWLVLAYALEVPPLMLALPTENTDYSVTPTFTTHASHVANWIRGKGPLEPPYDDSGSEWMVRKLRYIAQWYEAFPYLSPEAPDAIEPDLERTLEAYYHFFVGDITVIEDPKFREALSRLPEMIEAAKQMERTAKPLMKRKLAAEGKIDGQHPEAP